MKKDSLKKILSFISGFQVLSVLLIFTVFSVFTYFDAKKRAVEDMSENLGIYKVQIEDRLALMENDVYNILDNQVILSKLLSYDDSERLTAQVALRDILRSYTTYGAGGDCYAVYNEFNDVYLASWTTSSNNVLYIKTLVSERLKEIYRSEKLNPGWNIEAFGEEFFVYQTYKWGGRIIGAFIDMDTIANIISPENTPGTTFVFADSEGKILKIKGDSDVQLGGYENINTIPRNGLIEASTIVKNGEFKIYAISGNLRILRQLGTTSVFLGIALILIFITGVYFNRTIKNRIIAPLLEMEDNMNSIKDGERMKIREDGQLEEFSSMAGAFNRLMTEIFDLKIESYKRQLALSDAELKYVRLQIRPHFFINALTSISSLSKKRKGVEIDKYIDALTKNIRYMFKSGLHTVSIKEEMDHVKNYFEMQELKYPGMVFYYIDLPEELADWEIPQMLIHTVIENEYKYAVSNEALLTVFIKVSLEKENEEELLYIEIEDDGKGYPCDVIEYINKDYREQDTGGSRVGLFSLKRLLYLMYDRDDLMVIGNAAAHGAITRFRIPKQCKKENLRESDESIDS